ncbi:hypothetical protein D0T12_31520 [Actinomadura spongiicola]|uniref:Uncharacterized protein n=1 Tax=Actinomadura spongiicola TaxID=2303421 RepID=A0A372G875_9ACTN|nr:hypothetical protein [Actinomadura spongiicola]RFS81580.1 hypothetical protein D0T12_31520 [Actinomadura spongiicola]
MNDDLAAVLFDVVERQERHIRANEYLAIAALDGQRKLMLSDYDYLRDRAAAVAFEQRAAVHVRRVAAVRWVLAVPQVWVINERDVAARAPSPHPLRPGEEEGVTWMGFDQEDGIDYGVVPYTRRPSGEPVFDDPKVFTVPVIPGDLMPGHSLLRALLDDESPTED